MRWNRTEFDPLSLDLTAMIDVIFILLIFWMAVTRLAEARGDPAVDTPHAERGQATDLPRELLTVTLLADGRTVIVDDRRLYVDDLIAEWDQTPLAKHVLIRAAADADCADVARLGGKLHDLGFARIGLAARKESP
ncbi:MAG: hypothetical protein GY778_24975 [bacterium]|nr:hypothetical protein [bacterium]